MSQKSRDYYRRQQALARLTAEEVKAYLQALGPAAFLANLPTVARPITKAQEMAAASAGAYVASHAKTPPEQTVKPQSFSGRAANGAPLLEVLARPVRSFFGYTQNGGDVIQAERFLTSRLVRIAGNEVQQAGNNAAHIQLTATPTLNGYVRQLTGNSCSRCVILAGRFYRWSSGFRRHPQCDCVHIPAEDAGAVSDEMTNPRKYFDSLSKEAQDKKFGKAGAEAIREGADMSQVVNVSNSRSGLYDFDGVQGTWEGTTVRQGRAGRRLARETGLETRAEALEVGRRSAMPRLTPKDIYRQNLSRTETRELLRFYGYLDSTPIDRSIRGMLDDLGYTMTGGARLS